MLLEDGFVLLKKAIGWVITLIVAGIGAGLVVVQATHAPMSDGQQNAFLAQECPFYVMSKGSIEDNGACSVGEHGSFYRYRYRYRYSNRRAAGAPCA